jgi:EAL domain-containing protein (putative c-di-GMP-specific phosphodiesterase class I)
VEALLRWAHPQRGLLRPDEFIAIAEEGRLMPQIGQWMFSTLRSDIALWNAHSLGSMQIAFNVSTSQLDAPDFLDGVGLLTTGGFPGAHELVAEIESRALTSMSESRFLVFSRMREMEILLHLDHFGRGPISLQSLHSFPFSLLKLDLSLIERLGKEAGGDGMIRTAIELAHHLGMKAGAVGVETSWQMRILKDQCCDALQGYLIGHPMTAKELLKWKAKGAP